MNLMLLMMNLPIHSRFSLLIMLGSFLLCLVIYLSGIIIQRFQKSALPPVPLFASSTFPGPWDQALTLFFAGFFTFSTAVSMLHPSMVQELTWISLVSMLLMYLPMLVRYFGFVPRNASCPPLFLAAGYTIAGVLIIYLLVMATDAFGLSQWIMEKTGAPELQDSLQMFQSGTTEKRWIIAAMAILVAPVAEECCFRGFLYNVLKQASGRTAAVMASALFFASIHTSLPQLLPLFIFGVIQCLAYEFARSLWLPIAIHALFNITSLLALLLLKAS